MARTESSKIDRIKGIPMFDRVSGRGLKKLAQACDELEFEAGYTLISEGSLSTEIFVIDSGVASVTVGGDVVAEIIEGQVIGELAFLDPGPATATVTAKTAISALVIPHNRFQAIIDDTPEILDSVARDLAGRLRRMDARQRYESRG
jgi:CRP-like cAMP-binding protein